MGLKTTINIIKCMHSLFQISPELGAEMYVYGTDFSLKSGLPFFRRKLFIPYHQALAVSCRPCSTLLSFLKWYLSNLSTSYMKALYPCTYPNERLFEESIPGNWNGFKAIQNTRRHPVVV